jgi:uncharacterized lipoprotein YddW (UPF0748 family)
MILLHRRTLLISHFLFLISYFSFAQPKYEFRAVWIATVDNIDWPSKGNFNTENQKAEFIRQLDMHKRNGINAVIVQVRPAADAFYPSPYEPWSEWLTGKQGQPPSVYYDPLQFMIDETHKRGMEFHAWCNPYRAIFKIGQSSISSTHITRIHPEWFLTYGDTKYFDPGNKDVQQYVTSVIRDIVARYDVDALHFDDYFYPYRIPGREFPDNISFGKYGNGMSREDWRRSNVDSIIVMLNRTIKDEKKYCKFGISPFGVWRNKSQDVDGSDTRAGQTNYDDLYADILLWLKKGWIDYVAPQIYWEFEQKNAPYGILLDWWSKHSYDRHCYIGLGIYKAGTNPAWRDRTQLPRQIESLRQTSNIQGMIFFSSTTFQRNPNGWNDSLQNNYYKYPALIPPMNWIDSTKPTAPVINTEYNKDSLLTIVMQQGSSTDDLRGYGIYKSADQNLKTDSVPVLEFIPYQADAKFILRGSLLQQAKGFYYYITAISKTNNESAPVMILNASATTTKK